jgi:predicted nucleotide-binding protein
MYFHVIITQKSKPELVEYKLDLNEEKLQSQFLTPFENGENIFVNGINISLDDLDRMSICKSKDHSSKTLPIIRLKTKNGDLYPGLPDKWHFINECEDVTDDFIQGAPGYKKIKSVEKIIESKPIGNKIFVVHGHDELMEQTVARTLEKLNLVPIIMHEQPNKNKTIIQKLSDYADSVSFAIVLLSPDDKGYKKDQNPETAKFRARQNVILELGYFIGKLGMDKVVTLLKDDPDFENPSDYHGVLYTPFDNSGKWRLDLVKELREAGYNVDASMLP